MGMAGLRLSGIRPMQFNQRPMSIRLTKPDSLVLPERRRPPSHTETELLSVIHSPVRAPAKNRSQSHNNDESTTYKHQIRIYKHFINTFPTSIHTPYTIKLTQLNIIGKKPLWKKFIFHFFVREWEKVLFCVRKCFSRTFAPKYDRLSR